MKKVSQFWWWLGLIDELLCSISLQLSNRSCTCWKIMTLLDAFLMLASSWILMCVNIIKTVLSAFFIIFLNVSISTHLFRKENRDSISRTVLKRDISEFTEKIKNWFLPPITITHLCNIRDICKSNVTKEIMY